MPTGVRSEVLSKSGSSVALSSGGAYDEISIRERGVTMTMKARAETQKRPAGRRKTFLVVVDKNPSDLFSTGVILQRLDYAVITAASAEDGIRFTEIARPAAIITELLLPKMSGMDLLSRIKQDRHAKDIPVIILTRLEDPKIEELCKVAGCASYLVKPVDPNTLYRSIQHAIEATPRHYIRLKTCLKVLIGDEARDNAARSDYVTALSENGIYVRTDQPRTVNSKLPLTMFIAGRKVVVRAVVLYRVTGASGPLKEPGMGLKFVDIGHEDRDFIRTFIREQITKDLVS